ncbi:MAG: 50S ribosomal protein L29 [Bacteroidetes bacterium]|nr:50S ribosomal protein L29 [Bacteroidota bacterium]MCH8325134.1 50S ribosomal protein L29 [Bacteroidota bacterium]
MKAHEVRELKKEELIKRIEEEEKNVIDLRFTHQLKQLTNTAKLKMTKNDIARMKTILKEIESAGNISANINEGVTA